MRVLHASIVQALWGKVTATLKTGDVAPTFQNSHFWKFIKCQRP